jgi:hypothetical protein
VSSIESISIIPSWAQTVRLHIAILQQENPPVGAVKTIKEEIRGLAIAQALNMIETILDDACPDSVSNAVSGLTVMASRQDVINNRVRGQA